MPTATPIMNSAYIGLGLTIRALQRATESFDELEKRLTGDNDRLAQGLQQARQTAEALRSQIEVLVTPYVERLQAQVDALVSRLPEPAQKTYADALTVGRQVVEGIEVLARELPAADERPAAGAKAKIVKGTKTTKTTKPKTKVA